MTDPFAALGRRLGMTAGQAWTAALGLLLGLVLLAVSVPPVIDQRNTQPTPTSSRNP